MIYDNDYLKELENHNKFRNIFDILLDEDIIYFESMLVDISKDLCKILLDCIKYHCCDYYQSTEEYVVSYMLNNFQDVFCDFDEIYEDFNEEEFERIINLVLEEMQKRKIISYSIENDYLYHIIYKENEIKMWIQFFEEENEMYERLLDFSYFIISGDKSFFDKNRSS